MGLLCELADKTLVTSLRWSQDGSYISIGKDDGLIEIWDIESNTKLRTLNCDNHLTRIALQSWNQHVLTSGSRMGHIYFSDVRVANHLVNKIKKLIQQKFVVLNIVLLEMVLVLLLVLMIHYNLLLG